jgi:hypothetical protein
MKKRLDPTYVTSLFLKAWLIWSACFRSLWETAQMHFSKLHFNIIIPSISILGLPSVLFRSNFMTKYLY